MSPLPHHSPLLVLHVEELRHKLGGAGRQSLLCLTPHHQAMMGTTIRGVRLSGTRPGDPEIEECLGFQ